jgi:HD-GYP domain-containing protein (c-di-GMP phosphodiesterase class II)
MNKRKPTIYNEIIFYLQEIVKFLHDEPEHALEELEEIASLIDSNIPFGAGHSRRVSEYALEVGKRLALSDRELVYLETAALLHDFGKIGMDLKILEKPGPLTDTEKRQVDEHVLRGYYILSIFPEFEEPLKGILSHHERYDGTGYPNGLSAETIPLTGRIIAVADAYDAMTSERPYREKKTSIEAMRELEKQSGSQFDPDVVIVFVDILSEQH